MVHFAGGHCSLILYVVLFLARELPDNKAARLPNCRHVRVRKNAKLSKYRRLLGYWVIRPLGCRAIRLGRLDDYKDY